MTKNLRTFVVTTAVLATSVIGGALFAPVAVADDSCTKALCAYDNAGFTDRLTLQRIHRIANYEDYRNDKMSSWRNTTAGDGIFYKHIDGAVPIICAQPGHKQSYVGWDNNDEVSSQGLFAENHVC